MAAEAARVLRERLPTMVCCTRRDLGLSAGHRRSPHTLDFFFLKKPSQKVDETITRG
jgi:hypothetical protein